MVSPFTTAKRNPQKKPFVKVQTDLAKKSARKKSGRPSKGLAMRRCSASVTPPVCSRCERIENSSGNLKYCSKCLRGFHLRCFGNDDRVTDSQPWTCPDCLDNRVRCFDCKEYCLSKDQIVRCSHKNCLNNFHESCARRWETLRATTSSGMARRGYTCPQHFCNSCHRGINWGQFPLVCCLSCPVAYHPHCFPKHVNQFEDNPGFLLCERHRTNQDSEKKYSPMSVFSHLPIPEVPVNFEIPAYLKKRKLLDYSLIRRNFYIVKKHQDDVESMLCRCTGNSCDSSCLCMHAHYSCTASCNCQGKCSNKAFHVRKAKDLRLAMTEKCGWGIKAGEDISEGEFLIEYVGEVIDDKQCEQRLWKMKKESKSNFYLLEISREMVIDATYKGNKSRFINHSCHPNTELQKWQNEGETRIGVFAIMDIKKGEYVTYDYQFINFGTKQECHCGATDCRGILGVKPSRQKLTSDAATKIVTEEVILSTLKKKSETLMENSSQAHPECIGLRICVWWPMDKQFYRGVITDYDPVDKMHTVCYDDGEVEKLNMNEEKWDVESHYLETTQRGENGVNASLNSTNKTSSRKT